MKYLCLILLLLFTGCSHKTPPSSSERTRSKSTQPYIPPPPPPSPETKAGSPKFKPDTDGDGVVDQFDQESHPVGRNLSNTQTTQQGVLKTKRNQKKSGIEKLEKLSFNNVDESNDPGKLVYHIPDTMQSFKTYIIKIRINRDTTDKKIFENIGKVVDTTIKTSSKMEVIIIDPSPKKDKSFEIVKSNSDRQIVDKDEFTEWVYSVTPIKSGKLKLSIVVSIIKNGDKKQIVYFDDVYVRSNPPALIENFISNNWHWGVSTIIIPLIVWWYKKRNKKKKLK